MDKGKMIKNVIKAIVSIFFLVGITIVSYMFFKENAWPIDYKVTPMEWAKSFKNKIVPIVFAISIFINIIVFLAIGRNNNNCTSRLWWIILTMIVVLSIVEGIVAWLIYPEESICIWLRGIYILLINIIIYWCLTSFYPKFWNFYPFIEGDF